MSPRQPTPGWMRLRWAVYLAFVLIAGAALLQVWQAQRFAEHRLLDADVLQMASAQSRLTQRLGSLASALLAQPERGAELAAEMSRELGDSRRTALQCEALAREFGTAGTTTEAAFDHWHSARERLWYRGETLLNALDRGGLDVVARRAAAVQLEADKAALAAQALLVDLGRRAHGQQESGIRTAHAGAALTLLLLLTLFLAVVVPSLRALQAQAQRLAAQARENERLAMVAEHTGNLVLITDASRRLVWTNEAFTRHTGYELHEVLGRSPGELLQSERTDAAAVQRLREALDAGRPMRLELLNRSKDGRDYWIDTDIQPLHGPAGELSGFLAVQTVITEQVTQRLRSAALLGALPTAVVVHGEDGRVVDANPAARSMLGVHSGDPPEALQALLPLREDLARFETGDLPARRTLDSKEPVRGQVMGLCGEDGERRWVLVNTQPLNDALGAPAGAVVCYVDISERRRLLEQIRDSARCDPLTHMPNRSVVLERVQRAIEHRKRHPGYGFAVLFMDIDRFKQVNDTLGHGAGDELLRQVAARLTETLRPGDAVARVGSELHTAARIGGDEFVIVLEGMHDDDDACIVAERLLHALSQPFLVEGRRVPASVSIGIVSADRAGDSAESVLRDCDTAMYEAKRAGRGRYVLFDASMHDRVATELELESDLRRALAADELFVVYQPVVDLQSRRPIGVEALVRWNRPGHGVEPPGNFIELAEECGLIDAIGDVVLNTACAQFARWQRQLGEAAPAQLAVNLSRAQLKVTGLVGEVLAVLEANAMRPEQLQLEVTESFAAQDEQVKRTLHQLKAAGVRLALDDFGTGYSSLSCLHQLPVDTVKIDRSFVGHARSVEYHRVLIAATIRVARTLGMTTVAEGIETDDQAELMQELDCDRGQGYLLGRPMPADEFERWLEREGADTRA